MKLIRKFPYYIKKLRFEEYTSISEEKEIKKIKDIYKEKRIIWIKYYRFSKSEFKQLNENDQKDYYKTLVDIDIRRLGYTLEPSPDATTEHFKIKIEFIKQLIDNTVSRSISISQIRQRNLNFALLVFGALITFTYSSLGEDLLIPISIFLPIVSIAFWLTDHRHHKYIHGWAETQKLLEQSIKDLLNKDHKIIVPRYSKIGEYSAERCIGQPLVFLLLFIGSLINFINVFMQYNYKLN